MSKASLAGAGLKLEGYPTDEKEFYWILALSGCHPKATERILGRLKEKSYDLLTVRATLNFYKIKLLLGEIGVKLSFIEPLENWEKRYHDGKWPEELLEKVQDNLDIMRLKI